MVQELEMHAVLPRNDDGVSAAIPLGGSGFRHFGNSHSGSSIFVSFFILIVQANQAFSLVAIGACNIAS